MVTYILNLALSLIFIGIIFGIIWLFKINNAINKIGNLKLQYFGASGKKIEGYDELVKVQVYKYSKQQSFAFGLTFFAISLSLALGAFIIVGMTQGAIDWKFWSQAIGLGSGSIMTISSFRLYKIASEKIEKLLK
jgi:uncharacterized protein YqhQ